MSKRLTSKISDKMSKVKNFLNKNAAVADRAELTQSPESAVGTAVPFPIENKAALEEAIVEALRTVYDPEIPVNIYDLGLIYKVAVDDIGEVKIDMTLTAPGCPVAATFPKTVEDAVKAVNGVVDATVELVWDPVWTVDNMSDAAKLQLGIFG